MTALAAAPPWTPPLDSADLADALAKIRQWGPYDGDAWLDDVADALDSVPPAEEEIEELGQRLRGHLMQLVSIALNGEAERRDERASSRIHRARAVREGRRTRREGAGSMAGRLPRRPGHPVRAARRYRQDRARRTRPRTGGPVRQHFWRGKRVPYITAWTSESVSQPPVIRITGRGGEGIGFPDEVPVTDRRYEALWVRSGLARGRGEPDFRRINTHRQKRAMRYDLCAVCGETVLSYGADDRTLYLLGAETPIAEGETTTAPPLHSPCAVEAIDTCPPLRRSHVVALVEYSPLWGVAGVVFDPVTLAPLPNPGPRPDDLQHVHVGDKEIRWTLASFTVHSLHGVTPVSTDELREMAERQRVIGGRQERAD
ncbi:DUF6415 family natural product biosynthesis protein [Streptomyces pacificus]|uniref:DUF6415 family natural product biosynthesis protein n=1 Tax=Streptomyces pacificus TaxID=2705029 RepID=UPI00156411D7|nr:DUF6415 family natural product biosynthesis protein [Streptomyces pacificus]